MSPIASLRLINAAPIGTGAEMLNHIHEGILVSGKKAQVSFDKDPRFVRVVTPGRDETDYVDLIPLSNVASIRPVIVEKK